ncbi:phage tail protein [Photorhabdus sp. RM323S]|uniref:phage tail protein n=1 Tax=Photorhabdus sp. RM323S TaxID=3342828 RepID=UPI0036DD2626
METVNLAQGAYPGLRSVNEIPSLGYNGAFQGREHTNYAKGISVGDSDYGQIWVNSSGRLFAQFSNNNGAKPGGECVYTDDIIVQKANNAVPSSRKINGKTLSEDISLSAGDVGALPETVYVESIPTRRFVGAFSGGGGAGWVKGINIGTGGDTGQIYVNQYGELYAYFFNTNGSIDGGPVSNCPLGAPVPWPLPNAPAGYLTCNGQTFVKSHYPKLAAAYPSGVLPDLRGEFIRGWDDSRGIDGGRGILSWQTDEFKSHAHSYAYITEPGLGRAGGTGAHVTTNETDKTGGSETRPRNIAFNYIVRAA